MGLNVPRFLQGDVNDIVSARDSCSRALVISLAIHKVPFSYINLFISSEWSQYQKISLTALSVFDAILAKSLWTITTWMLPTVWTWTDEVNLKNRSLTATRNVYTARDEHRHGRYVRAWFFQPRCVVTAWFGIFFSLDNISHILNSTTYSRHRAKTNHNARK